MHGHAVRTQLRSMAAYAGRYGDAAMTQRIINTYYKIRLRWSLMSYHAKMAVIICVVTEIYVLFPGSWR